MFKEFIELRHVRGFKTAVLPLSIAFFVYTFGWGITSPMFSIFINNITGSLFLTGVVLSLTTMMGIFLNFPLGILEGRLKIKRVLQAMLLIYVAIALLYPTAGSLVPLLALSIVRGVASSFLWLTSWSYIFYYTRRKEKGKETGFFSSMNDLASALSPLLGGFAVALSFFAPFYILAATSLAAFLIITFFIKENPKPKVYSFKKQFQTLRRRIKDKAFVKTILMIFVFYALINVYYSFVSVLLNGEGVSIFFIGVLLTVSLLITALLEVTIGNLIDRHGLRKVLSLAVIAAAVTGFSIVLSQSVVYLLLAITLFTISYTIIFIGLYSRMEDIIRADKAAMTGAIATFKDAGYTIGPLLAGMVMLPLGIKETFMLVSGMFLLLLPITLSLKD